LTRAPQGYSHAEAATLPCAGVTAWRGLVVRGQVRPGEKARTLTDGRGVDHVIEVGGPATFAQSMAACRLGGHIAVIGLLSGVTAEVNIPALFSAQLRVSGISVASRADQEDMIRAISMNRLKPVIARSFKLEEIGEAFESFHGKEHFGKISIEI
jgi:NADPH:quinone reductase-like Zn-dependent oxidoreductase